MKHTRISKTQNSLTGTILCTGKLVLIHTEDKINAPILFNKKSGAYVTYDPLAEPLIEKNKDIWIAVKPVIISETEQILAGDMRLLGFGENGAFIALTSATEENMLYRDKGNWNKIIAGPDNFSKKQIEMIVNGKLKNQDEVLVECYRRGENHEGMDADLTGGLILGPKDYYCIRLNKENHITMHSAIEGEVTYSKKRVLDILKAWELEREKTLALSFKSPAIVISDLAFENWFDNKNF